MLWGEGAMGRAHLQPWMGAEYQLWLVPNGSLLEMKITGLHLRP